MSNYYSFKEISDEYTYYDDIRESFLFGNLTANQFATHYADLANKLKEVAIELLDKESENDDLQEDISNLESQIEDHEEYELDAAELEQFYYKCRDYTLPDEIHKGLSDFFYNRIGRIL